MPLRLEPTEREVVIVQISNAMIGTSSPAAFLALYLGSAVVAKIPDPGTRDNWARAGLVKAEEADYQLDGTHPLLELLRALGRQNQTILKMYERLQNLPRPANPFAAHVLDNGQAFLDRESFRSTIEKLFAQDARPILRVFGDRKSGKWYTFKFLIFLALSGKPFSPISFECGASTTALSLAQSLLQRMGTSDWQKPPFSEADAPKEMPLRVGQRISDWFLNAALQSGQTWWFFVKFLDISIAADTGEFIRQLALQCALNPGARRKSFRLVLVNFADELPRDLRRLQEREEFKLDRMVWETYLHGYITHLKTTVDVEKQAELDDAQPDILSRIRAATDEEFLSTLCHEVEDLTDELAN